MMTSAQLFRAIGEMDDRFLMETLPVANRRPVWIKWAAVAACATLMAALGGALWMNNADHAVSPSVDNTPTFSTVSGSSEKTPQGRTKADATPIDIGGRTAYYLPPMINVSRCTPSPGTVYREMYGYDLSTFKPTDLLLISVTIFDDDGRVWDKDRIEAEAKRMSDLGIEVYTRDNRWIGYWGEEKQLTTVLAVMTREQYEDFTACEQYGYELLTTDTDIQAYTHVE